ncbi:MAG: hypothetical protein ACM3WV_08195 [Bacillota bacterium]
MKKLVIVLSLLGLMSTVSLQTLGAIHSPDEDCMYLGNPVSLMLDIFESIFSINTAEQWYSIGKPSQSVSGGFNYHEDISILRVDYSQDEFTFASGAAYLPDGGDSLNHIRGSYVHETGIFGGLDYISESGYSDLFASVGYRYMLGEDGFIAGSVDYYTDESQLIGYDIDAKYYLENMKLYGQIYIPDEGDTFFEAGCNMKLNDEVTGGVHYVTVEGENGYAAGLTWAQDQFALNGEIGSDIFFDDYYSVGGSFDLSEQFTAGFQYMSYDLADEPVYGVFVKYKGGSFIINLSFAISDVII